MFPKFLVSASISLFFFCSILYGQSEKDLLKTLAAEDRSAVDAIVLYPEEVRNHIFQIAMHPEILIKISGMQEKTEQAFRDYIADYSQEEQANFYELARYPGLIRDLAGKEKQSKAEITALLNNYPEEIHETALELGRQEYQTLHQIYQLNRATKQAFDELLKPYPSQIQTSIRELVTMPEILTILTDNIDLTILVGDVYKNDPAWVQSKAEALNLEVARRQAEELEDYKQQLEQDPEAYQEMLDAAVLYAEDNNIPESEYNKESAPETTVKVVYSYPYWYGYPHWYTYPYWTPVPYYYRTGFYIGPGGVAVVIGLPSYHYVHWHYTYYPHRHVHLHAHYHRHYQRHPHGHRGFHAAVNVNVNKRVNVRSRQARDNRSNRTGTIRNSPSKLELGKERDRSQNFERFKANDNHRGSWSNRGKGNAQKLAQGKGKRR